MIGKLHSNHLTAWDDDSISFAAGVRPKGSATMVAPRRAQAKPYYATSKALGVSRKVAGNGFELVVDSRRNKRASYSELACGAFFASSKGLLRLEASQGRHRFGL